MCTEVPELLDDLNALTDVMPHGLLEPVASGGLASKIINPEQCWHPWIGGNRGVVQPLGNGGS